MSISKEDRERIATAIQSAEARTSSEIVCVLAQASSHTTALPILIAAIVALALPWLLMSLTALTLQRILSLQVVIFIALLIVLCLPSVRVALMPRKARRAIAHRVAMEQFMRRGISRVKDRPGILIFVSLAERYARIVVDDEVAARIPQSKWQGAVDALITHMRDGRIADGFIVAIEACGNELAQHFPLTDAGRNELPDRIYLI
jgi:putative membrane protein